MTPPETYRVAGVRGGWRVRVTPNKFAALVPGDFKDLKVEDGLERRMTGLGVHEVIVETPSHNTAIAFLSKAHVRDLLLTYRERYREIEKATQLEQVVIFKNHGVAAGTSLEHPHSQLIATPIVPSNIRYRMEQAVRYYDEHRECLYCRMMRDEIEEGTRVVQETRHHVAFVPFAAMSPFHMWIMPKRHCAAYSGISDAEAADLAALLRSVLGKLYAGLRDPDYNYAIRSAPGESRHVRYFHWYLSIVPRVTKMAGFEIGSGMFINTALPESSAKFLRAQKPLSK